METLPECKVCYNGVCYSSNDISISLCVRAWTVCVRDVKHYFFMEESKISETHNNWIFARNTEKCDYIMFKIISSFTVTTSIEFK